MHFHTDFILVNMAQCCVTNRMHGSHLHFQRMVVLLQDPMNLDGILLSHIVFHNSFPYQGVFLRH